MVKKITVPFSGLSSRDVSIAGGKGAQLGEMLRAGFPVPNGFVATTYAYCLFLEENKIAGKIEDELRKVKPNKMETINSASRKIRGIIEKAKMPAAVEAEITARFAALNAKLVAVRSSATAEDSSSASWAGELESYMNVGKGGVCAAVKKCWGSLFTPRAIFYRFEKKMGNKNVGVGVVVQAMVDSEVAGVAFTVNPITKDMGQVVIEAGLGLGESVVLGEITPDKYVVNKAEGYIEDIEVNKQGTMIIKAGKKTKKVAVPKARQERQKLDGSKIMELAEMCKRIEKHYKAPQDIEWALEKGRLYIVQARPVTTL